jgi:hypothetical protein
MSGTEYIAKGRSDGLEFYKQWRCAVESSPDDATTSRYSMSYPE